MIVPSLSRRSAVKTWERCHLASGCAGLYLGLTVWGPEVGARHLLVVDLVSPSGDRDRARTRYMMYLYVSGVQYMVF